MAHWQIKLIGIHGDEKWHGLPVRKMSKIYPGMWTDKIEPYRYNSLEEARLIVQTAPHSMKSNYFMKIFKITPKRKR